MRWEIPVIIYIGICGGESSATRESEILGHPTAAIDFCYCVGTAVPFILQGCNCAVITICTMESGKILHVGYIAQEVSRPLSIKCNFIYSNWIRIVVRRTIVICITRSVCFCIPACISIAGSCVTIRIKDNGIDSKRIGRARKSVGKELSKLTQHIIRTVNGKCRKEDPTTT